MNSYNILVVEDEKEIADAIEIYLLNQGYNVFKGYNGLEGLKVIENQEIHLAIIDIMMPKMDGITLTMKLRENHNFPVIMLSAKSEEVDKIMGLNIGADDYVTKPFKPLELLARVNSQLRRYTKYLNMVENKEQKVDDDDGVFAIGGLELNENTKEVSVDGKHIKATPIEFKILSLLMRNAGRVFSADEIYERVWNDNAVNTDTVMVHVRNIREKIEVDPKNPKYLKVVWGVGYKIEKFKDKYIVTIIVFILMLSASLGMISQYSTIQAGAKGGAKNPFEQESFVDNMYKGSYVLYHNMKEEQEGKMIQPSKLFISKETMNYIKNVSKEKDTYDGSETYYTDDSINADFNQNFENWESFIKESGKNLKYYLVDKESNFEFFNDNKELGALDTTKNYASKEDSDENKSKNTEMSDEERQKQIKDIKENYRFYIVMNFDKDGKVNVLDSYGVNQKVISQMLLSKAREDLMNTTLGGNPISYKLSPIKNVTLVYAVPKVISKGDGGEYSYGNIYNNDSISSYINNVENNSYYKISGMILKIILAIVVIVALAFPYRKSKELLGFDTLSRIPLEILFIILAILQGIVDLYPTSIISNTLSGNYVEYLINNDISAKMASILVSLMNLTYWFVIFSIIFVFIILLKHILNVGIKEYFIKNTVTGMFFVWLIKSGKVVINQIRITDLKEKPNKTIAIILGINLLIIVIMCSFWFFGIILALIYSVVLFKILSDYSKKTIYEYNQLLDVTKKISDGNLEVNMERDLGFFNPIKDELGNIQAGFKKAVDEEVKSQKMKTELISNVSHDLKTPLTSIITYIDLLKDESITDENRKLYIDTLDRKSQRLQHLIEDLFEVSKVNSGDVHLNIMNVDIVSLMKQTLLELDDKLADSSLIVKNNFSNEKIILPLDSQRTFRVFENLIINISKYAMPNSRVYIDILETDNKVSIMLKNMSATEIDFSVDDIMERFVRGDKSRNTEGSGLGLAIAKSFIELQGGKMNISVDGDLFKVTITFNKN